MTLIVICGATATGKSDLAVALAKEIKGEIVNADSMQLYNGMDIGTAKLSLEERMAYLWSPIRGWHLQLLVHQF